MIAIDDDHVIELTRNLCLVDLHILITIPRNSVGDDSISGGCHFCVGPAALLTGASFSGTHSSRDVPLGPITRLTHRPPLVEEYIGSLRDDGLLIRLGHTGIVEVIPIAVQFVLPISSVVASSHAPVMIAHSDKVVDSLPMSGVDDILGHIQSPYREVYHCIYLVPPVAVVRESLQVDD